LVSGKKRVAKLGKGDFRTEQVSPGGLWEIISGNIADGDYIYRTLYLLHRRDGTIRAIGEQQGLLNRRQLRTMLAESVVAVGETAIRWLNDEALLIGTKLAFPGKALVELGGAVAP
jgi:hypothetical protein